MTATMAMRARGMSTTPDPHEQPVQSPADILTAISRLTRRLRDAIEHGETTLTAGEAHVYLAALAAVDQAAARRLR